MAVGKVISKYKTAKHFAIEITDTTLAITRNQAQIDAETALDGFYVLRGPSPPPNWMAPAWSPPTRTSSTSRRASLSAVIVVAGWHRCWPPLLRCS